jgi:hypothetical protein
MSDKYKAWPHKQYDGNQEGYDEYESDRKAYTIDNKFTALGEIDPSTILRIAAAYDDERGVRIPAETVAAYDRRSAADKALNKTIWAKIIRGYTGDARKIADAAGEEDARKVFAAIKHEFGTQSNKQITKLVRTLNKKTKKPEQSILSFNTQWRNSIKKLESNGTKIEDNHMIDLYLISLGKPYKVLESMASVMTKKDRTLSNIMKLAIDHQDSENESGESDDEGTINNIALSARNRKGKQKHHHALNAEEFNNNVPCEICKHPFHSSKSCFKGGLRHLDQEERRDYLATKKRKREEQKNKHQETAHSATKRKNHNKPTEAEYRLTDTAYAALHIQLQCEEEKRKELKVKLKENNIQFTDSDSD